VHPGGVPPRDRDRLFEGIEAARVQIAALQAHYGRGVLCPERFGEGVDTQPPLLVRRHRCRRAEAQIARRQVDGLVSLRPD